MTKITIDKALIEQAIADLEHISTAAGRVEFIDGTCQKLREALAEPAPEPAAEIYAPSYLPRAIGLRFTHYGTTLPAGTKLYAAPVREPAPEPVAEVVDYILQDDIHNRLTPRVVDIAYSAFVLGSSGTRSDDDGPCDWFNDTKPMVMKQIAKIKNDLAEAAAPVREILGSDMGAEDKCPTCGSDCNERDELIKAERHIERLQRALGTALKAANMC